jgi:hypothetical protein
MCLSSDCKVHSVNQAWNVKGCSTIVGFEDTSKPTVVKQFFSYPVRWLAERQMGRRRRLKNHLETYERVDGKMRNDRSRKRRLKFSKGGRWDTHMDTSCLVIGHSDQISVQRRRN